ncbi:MAG: hypothetical protein QM770_04575 [Tepidisphaeraceae bacterium]
MRIAIVTEAALARSHGTGAQILQLAERWDFHHFHCYRGHGAPSEVPNSTLLRDAKPEHPLLQRVVRKLQHASGHYWWRRHTLNEKRFARLLAKVGPFDVTYVIAASEVQAIRLGQIVRQIGAPYVLNVVDLYQDEGLDHRSRQFKQLLEGATVALAAARDHGADEAAGRSADHRSARRQTRERVRRDGPDAE